MKIFILLLISSTVRLCAQNYLIDWHTLGGGGGASTGTVYSISGTIGQPDAGETRGRTYGIAGGFWSMVGVVPINGAPALRVQLNGGQVILAWPNPSTGFQLQETPNVAASTWMDVGETPGVVGSEKQVTLPSQPGNRFFRLRAR